MAQKTRSLNLVQQTNRSSESFLLQSQDTEPLLAQSVCPAVARTGPTTHSSLRCVPWSSATPSRTTRITKERDTQVAHNLVMQSPVLSVSGVPELF